MSTEQFRFKGRTEGADDWTEWLDRYVDGDDQIEYGGDDEFLEYEHRTVGVDGNGGGFILSPLNYKFDPCDAKANINAAAAYIKGTYGAVGKTGADEAADLVGDGFERGARGSTADEIRVTDPATGGQKGMKPEMYSLIPVWPQAEIARTYGHGATKYAADNWRRGYAWSLSISSLLGHINSWRFGETFDRDSGLHHLAHAAFHLNSLIEFQRLGLGTDDRGDVQR